MMKRWSRVVFIAPLCVLLSSLHVHAASAPDGAPKDEEQRQVLANYLVTFNPGAVSAANLVGVENSAINRVHHSQDLVLALKPLTSGSSKTGFGIAITPARTSLIPMSGKSYYNSDFMRLLGSTTLSYAENKADISSTSYRKNGFSIDASFYLNRSDDPAILAYHAFINCVEKDEAYKEQQEAIIKQDKVAEQKAFEKWAEASKGCIQNAKKAAPWNASRIAVAYGQGWIKPDNGSGVKESLGKGFIFSALFAVGENGAVNISHRRIRDEVDLTTLSTTPSFKDSNLSAIRFTYGSNDDKSEQRWLAEVSNASSSRTTEANKVFKYALGFDRKLAEGLWIEIRVGRSRVATGTELENTALLNVNWSPTSELFGSNKQ